MSEGSGRLRREGYEEVGTTSTRHIATRQFDQALPTSNHNMPLTRKLSSIETLTRDEVALEQLDALYQSPKYSSFHTGLDTLLDGLDQTTSSQAVEFLIGGSFTNFITQAGVVWVPKINAETGEIFYRHKRKPNHRPDNARPFARTAFGVAEVFEFQQVRAEIERQLLWEAQWPYASTLWRVVRRPSARTGVMLRADDETLCKWDDDREKRAERRTRKLQKIYEVRPTAWCERVVWWPTFNCRTLYNLTSRQGVMSPKYRFCPAKPCIDTARYGTSSLIHDETGRCRHAGNVEDVQARNREPE